MLRNVYEGEFTDDATVFRVTSANEQITDSLNGKRARITIEIIENNEQFEELMGLPPEVIADERDEQEGAIL